MNGTASTILAFTLGLFIGYKWPSIKKKITPISNKLKWEAIKGYLAIKNNVVEISGAAKKKAKGTNSKQSSAELISDST